MLTSAAGGADGDARWPAPCIRWLVCVRSEPLPLEASWELKRRGVRMDLERISTCTYPMREEDIQYALKVVADAGFKKVDVWGRMPHFSLDSAELDMD